MYLISSSSCRCYPSLAIVFNALPLSASSRCSASPTRTRLSFGQHKTLQELFAVDPSPNMVVRQQVAEQLGLLLSKVANWFRNLR
jgi:hypothetical protein